MVQDLGVLTVECLNSFIGKQTARSLSLFHLNVQSARLKEDNLSLFFDSIQTSFDVVMMTETWYRDDDDFFILPGYTHFFLNRSYSRGGGVSLQTRASGFEILSNYSIVTRDYEILCVKKGNHIYSVLYRPPNGNVSSFMQFLEALFCFANQERCLLFLGGDFNINMLEDSHLKDDFVGLLTSNNISNVIIPPTRITCTTSTLLDLFLTNHDENNISAGVLSIGISDHLPIIMFINKNMSDSTVPNFPTMSQDISSRTLEEFRETISTIDWSPMFNTTDADECYDFFISTFKNVYSTSFPMRCIRPNKKARKPWVNGHLLKLIKKKNVLYDSFVKTRDEEKLREFKKFRNFVNAQLRQAKRLYYAAKFDASCLRQPDIVWKQLHSLLRSPSQDKAIVNMTIHNKIISGTELADTFNDYFVSIGNSTHNSNAKDNLSRTSETMFLNPTDTAEVFSVFMNMKNSRSRDCDDLLIRPVKFVLDLIIPCVTHLYNLILSSGVFPKSMQVAKVSVLYKGGDKNDMSNYRPISILPVFSKPIEKIIYSRLLTFFEKYSVLTDSQFGFRRCRSTETALLVQKETILENFESKLLTLGIFVDFSKAFDRINHITLLDKLDCYGIRGIPLSLISSYLQYRSQYVQINNYRSSTQRINSGVPQGSILGPLLFIIYVNDIVNIETSAKFIIYADDTSIFFSDSREGALTLKANYFLNKLKSWVVMNSLVINTAKTKAVLFQCPGSRIRLSRDLFLGDCAIECVDSIKTLGVIFSCYMSWNNHVTYVHKKLCKVVGIMNKFRHILPVNIKKLIYNALFYPVLCYSHLVWGSTTKGNIDKLRLLQKKALRIIENVPRDYHSLPLFEKHKVIDITNLYTNRLIANYQRSVRENNAILLNLGNLEANESVHPSRHRPPWRIPFSRTNFGLQRYRHQLPLLLNTMFSRDVEIHSVSHRSIQEAL